jgi:hypothetical protein
MNPKIFIGYVSRAVRVSRLEEGNPFRARNPLAGLLSFE